MTRRPGCWPLCAWTLARHWGILLLLGCGTALRATAMAGYWPALIFIDTPRYLMDYALGIDPLGYRYLFTDPLLAMHAGLGGIVAVQHLFGLAMGVGLYALVLRHRGPRWLAALAAVPVLLDSYQLQAEQMIMSDVLFETLICAAFLVIAWPSAGKRIWVRVAVAALLVGVATTVREVGELAGIPLLAYAVLARRQDSPSSALTRAGRAATALAIFAVPVLTYMTFSANVLGAGFSLSNVDQSYLYARLADTADCATLRLPASERALCPPPGRTPGVDALANSATSPFRTFRSAPGVSRGSVISGFDLAVLTQQPLRVAGAVTGDAAKLFALTRDGDPGDPPIADSQFQPRYPIFQPAYGAAFDGPGEVEPRSHPAIDAVLRAYQLHGGFTPGPLLLLFALLSVFGALDPRAPRRLRAAAAAAAVFALAVVGGADCYEFTWRYQLPALPLLPPGGALGALAAADAVRRRMARRERQEELVLPEKLAPTSPDLVTLGSRGR